MEHCQVISGNPQKSLLANHMLLWCKLNPVPNCAQQLLYFDFQDKLNTLALVHQFLHSQWIFLNPQTLNFPICKR